MVQNRRDNLAEAEETVAAKEVSLAQGDGDGSEGGFETSKQGVGKDRGLDPVADWRERRSQGKGTSLDGGEGLLEGRMELVEVQLSEARAVGSEERVSSRAVQ